ncbi:MAG: hypothetical protein HY962_09210 [Ignavibacteriae bacterium]|nr:hypothetical protein [Ignavibacteriota bacterium]
MAAMPRLRVMNCRTVLLVTIAPPKDEMRKNVMEKISKRRIAGCPCSRDQTVDAGRNYMSAAKIVHLPVHKQMPSVKSIGVHVS